jgi:hypothetical protein
MSELRLSLPENIWYQSCLCDGLRTSCNRVFKNGNPWVLPVFFGDLAMTGQLKGPEDLPEILEVLNSSYRLVCITFWNGNHYNARVYYDCKWYSYDGLQQVKLQQISSYSADVPAGYSMSSCIYFTNTGV